MTNEITPYPNTKEIEVYKENVLSVQTSARDLIIESAKDMEVAADLLHVVKEIEDKITERKEAITRPLMLSLSSVRDLFKPLELGHVEAKKTIKAKMLAYQVAEEERIEAEKQKIAARVEKGTMRPDTAIKKLENMDTVPEKVNGSIGKISTRSVWKIRIVAETLIPREYLSPDMGKITEAVLKKNIPVAGVERYEEKIIVGR